MLQSVDNCFMYLYTIISCQLIRKDCRMKNHVAIYGSTKIKRDYCNDCKCYAFVIDNTIQCCLKPHNTIKKTNYKRMILSEGKKKQPPANLKREIIKRQDNKCLYCGIKFGDIYYKKDKPNIAKIHYDHLVPFAYLNSNPYNNWIGACNICNSIKGSKMFETIEEVKSYVKYIRGKKQIYYNKDLSNV